MERDSSLPILIVIVLIVMAGCLQEAPQPSEETEKTRENGLVIRNFTALHQDLEPGDRTQVLLRLENTNDQDMHEVGGVLSNTNPLTVDDEIQTSDGSASTCHFSTVQGVAGRGAGERVDCIWTVTVPESVNPPFSTPLTATVTHGAAVRTPAVQVRFQEEPGTIGATTATVNNQEVAVSAKAKDTRPLDTAFIEVTVTVENRGSGDFSRSAAGDAVVDLSYHGSMTEIFAEDQPETSGHARPCPKQVILQGQQTSFTCSFKLDQSKVGNNVIHGLAVEAGYTYMQSRETQVQVSAQ